MPEDHLADASAVAQSLSELTTGWAPAPGVDPATLGAARAALASSLLTVPPGVALRPAPLVAPSAAAPALETELREIAERARDAVAPAAAAQAAGPQVAAAQAPATIAVIRSPS